VIVTSHLTDSSERKADILSKWPGRTGGRGGRLIFALLCLHDERNRTLLIRGIMDFAGGDKKGEDRRGGEEARKKTAAENAARLAVAAIKT